MNGHETSISYASESVSEINQAVNADLKALKGWLEGNKLSLSVAKTEAMIIGSNGKLGKLSLSIQSNRTLRLVTRVVSRLSCWLRESNTLVFRLTIDLNGHLNWP